MEAPEFFAFPRLRYYECNLAHVWSAVAGKFERLPRRSASVKRSSFMLLISIRTHLMAC
jgi:hypothetical protein